MGLSMADDSKPIEHNQLLNGSSVQYLTYESGEEVWKEIGKVRSTEYGCHQSVAPTSLFWGLVYPIRTNNIVNGLQDLFLPTLSTRAMYLNTMAKQIFGSLGMLVLDLATLVVRLVTVIPRAIYNWTESTSHALYKQKELGAELKKLNVLHVRIDIGSRDKACYRFVNLRAVPDAAPYV